MDQGKYYHQIVMVSIEPLGIVIDRKSYDQAILFLLWFGFLAFYNKNHLQVPFAGIVVATPFGKTTHYDLHPL